MHVIINSPAPADYDAISVDLTFSSTVSRSCVNVIINDDNFPESREEIRFTLTTIDVEVTLNRTQGIIEIIDPDGKLVTDSLYIRV